jgi:hypothetical protein
VLLAVGEGGFRLRLKMNQARPERTDAAAPRLEDVLLAAEAVETVLAHVGITGAFVGVNVEDSGLHGTL